METKTNKKSLNFTEVKNHISEWLKSYCLKTNQSGYIIGVSGGIDSAVCSTLCAMTGLPLVVVRMSIHQATDQADRGAKHIQWLKTNFPNVSEIDIDLTNVYDAQMESIKKSGGFNSIKTSENEVIVSELDPDVIFFAGANTRSRLRMVTLYGIGNAHKLLVCGTGNKVEDYGVGFFTKFGDGGVDVSPIGELMKSEVYALGKELGVIQEILEARPTDGLWDDGRTDEDQIGASYDELEWALKYADRNYNDLRLGVHYDENLTERENKVLDIYWKRHRANQHKMATPPICTIENLK